MYLRGTEGKENRRPFSLVQCVDDDRWRRIVGKVGEVTVLALATLAADNQEAGPMK